MNDFDLKFILPKYIINSRRTSSKLGTMHLYKHTVELLNNNYHKDVINFSYRKMSKNSMNNLFIFHKGNARKALMRHDKYEKHKI